MHEDGVDSTAMDIDGKQTPMNEDSIKNEVHGLPKVVTTIGTDYDKAANCNQTTQTKQNGANQTKVGFRADVHKTNDEDMLSDDIAAKTDGQKYHLATIFQKAHTKVKLRSSKTCTFLVWLIWQPRYKILKNVSISDEHLRYTTNNENSSLVF